MSDQMMKRPETSAIEQVLIQGDLSKLNAEQRVAYYQRVCETLGLNPATQPFAYLTLNNKLVLYARKDCTEQLRKRDGISISIVGRELVEDVYVVTARATRPDGRSDESVGAVSVAGLKGEARANAYMKSETKAKRRVTLSICGLGILDETEVESVPEARKPVPAALPARAEPKGDACEEPDDAELAGLDQVCELGQLIRKFTKHGTWGPMFAFYKVKTPSGWKEPKPDDDLTPICEFLTARVAADMKAGIEQARANAEQAAARARAS